MEDLSVEHGIMGFDRASEVYAARRFPSRPLRFPVDLPVVEAIRNRDEIEAALPRVREVLARGLSTSQRKTRTHHDHSSSSHLLESQVGTFFGVGRGRAPAVASSLLLCQEMCRI